MFGDINKINLTQLKDYKSKRPVQFGERAFKRSSIFDNNELNRMVDESMERVLSRGYDKLVIPRAWHSIDEKSFPMNVRFVADTISSSGHRAFLCGGTVRDLVQGEEVNDFDLVTDATCEELEELFDNIQFFEIPTGHRFGYIDFGDDIIDIATMVNVPREYFGKNKVPDFDPSSLYSNSLLFDAYQRDLPFNSMYYDIRSQEVIDYLGGLYCLREGIVKTSCDPIDTFEYDPRIMLRALRFASRFNFSVDEDMDMVIREHGTEYLRRITPRAMTSNLQTFFSGGFAHTGTDLLLEYGLFTGIFPSVSDKISNHYYLDYVRHSARAADWLFAEGTWALPLVIMASFLWPAVKDAEERGEEDPVDCVLDSQKKVLSFNEQEEVFFRNTLALEYRALDKMGIKNEVFSIFEKSEFRDGLNMLRLYYANNREYL